MLRHPQVTYEKRYWARGWHSPMSPPVTGYLLQCPPKYVTGWNEHGTWNTERICGSKDQIHRYTYLLIHGFSFTQMYTVYRRFNVIFLTYFLYISQSSGVFKKCLRLQNGGLLQCVVPDGQSSGKILSLTHNASRVSIYKKTTNYTCAPL